MGVRAGRVWTGLGLLALMGLVLLQPAAAQFTVPTLTGRVVDNASILSEATEQQLTDLLADHEAATSNQVAVVTVSSLGGLSVEEAGLRVAETWALGQADRDNGALLLVAPNDREMRIEVGYGLEGALTDALAGRIIRNEILPYFRNGDFDTGVLVGMQAMLDAIEGEYVATEASEPVFEGIPWFVRLIIFLIMGMIPLVFIPTFLVAGEWGSLVFMGIFLVAGSGFAFFSFTAALIAAVLYPVALILANWWFRQSPKWEEARAKVKKVLDENKGKRVKVTIHGRTVTLGGITKGGGSGGGSFGGSSGGGSSFSGGGGSFGGGGASGSW